MGKRLKEVVIVQSSLEQQRLEKHNMLLDCKVQDIEILLLLGSLDDIIEVEVPSPAVLNEYMVWNLLQPVLLSGSQLCGLQQSWDPPPRGCRQHAGHRRAVPSLGALHVHRHQQLQVVLKGTCSLSPCTE